MLTIETFPLGPLATNAYVISDASAKKAIVIDPGMNPEPLLERVADLDIEAIILTHAHFDHIGGVDALRRLKRCPVYIHPLEAEWLTCAELNGSTRWPEIGPPIVTDPAEHLLADGQTLRFLGQNFQVFHTPGHSPGSVSLLWEKELFSGDVLFQLSVGRTDLEGGSSRQLYESIHNVLFKLDPETRVHPGHGPSTTIGFEKKNNPYV